MVARLSDVVGRLKKGNEETVEQQEEANESLKSIDRNIGEFLGLQKRKRLDDLEDRRERKSKTAGLAAGAVGLGAGSALSAGELMTGEGLGIGNLAKDLALLYLKYKAIKTAFSVLGQGIKKVFSGGDGDIGKRLNKLNADIDADLKRIDADLSKAEADVARRQADLNKAQADLEQRQRKTVNRASDGRFEAEDPRTRAAELEIREKQVAEAKAARDKALQEQARLEEAKAKAEMRRAELEAVEREKVKKKQLARIKEMEAADAARSAETDARAKGAADAQKQRLRIQEMSEADAAKKAELDARTQGAERAQRQRLRIAEMAEADAARASEADARAKGAEAAQQERVRLSEADTQTESRRRGGRRRKSPARVMAGAGDMAKVLGKAALPLEAAMIVGDALEGAGNQIQADLAEGKRTTKAEATAAGAGGVVAGVVGIADLVANLGVAGYEKVTGSDTGFTSEMAGFADEKTRSLVGGILKTFNAGQGELTPEQAAFLTKAGIRVSDFYTGMNAMDPANRKGVIGDFQKGISETYAPSANYDIGGSGSYTKEQLQSLERIAEINRIMEDLEKLYSGKAATATVVGGNSTRVDNSVRQTSVYQNGANNIDPSAYAIPGFGAR
jgi:hypothetical protein